MRRFRFRFESLLDVRKAREESALAALAISQRDFRKRIEEKTAILKLLEEAYQRRESFTRAGGFAVSGALSEQDYINGAPHRIRKCEQAIWKAKKAVEKALATYLQRRKETRAVEVIREKDFDLFKSEVRKRERRQIDEIVSMRAAREVVAREEGME